MTVFVLPPLPSKKNKQNKKQCTFEEKKTTTNIHSEFDGVWCMESELWPTSNKVSINT